MKEVLLISQAARGNRKALEKLVRLYYEKIYNYIGYRVQDFSAAEDLTQDTFVSAYRNLEQFDGSYEKAWLCRIAANKCTDYLKSAKRRSEPVDWDEMQDLPAEDTGPEQETYEALVREQLLQRCRQLKPPYDQIAELYFYREESPEAIAGKLNRNRKTVQTQIYRARSMLQKLYRKEEFL